MDIKATAITSCKECGSKDLSWFTNNVTYSGVQNGRLKASEVVCLFVLGCNECSATVDIFSADKIAELMNTRGA
ncbi:3'-5' exonuclease [Pseudomonas phage vB_Pae-SS2019XI]|uniref:3'-5' exonuclease n=1 Tax=Pseudomonas phage vB_Pae-SS2019XI TaxID=2660688 RepID=A0A6G6XGL7_9CAUD|nr:3'-5' exonuclease [Pseudomonas phage vB_Pae-SS2019XI]QIG56923.1 3'-5' exonuclease [Pseudomonas phage vB_Pae-SS2019XI]